MASTNDDELQTPKLTTIANIVKNFWNELKPNSDSDRKDLLDREREGLIESAEEMIKKDGSSSNQSCANVINAAEYLSNVEHGFDWVKFEKEKVLVDKADMASHLHSDPNLTIALDEAGEIFEKANSECLLKVNNHFQCEKIEAQKIDEFANLIVSGLT
uniref:Uncharacterized protein n=1 Tax=Acrobeloides nanus TaxID=290746 RepID=A0A914CLE5_9BILA